MRYQITRCHKDSTDLRESWNPRFIGFSLVQAQPRTGPTITCPPLPDDFKLIDDPAENIHQLPFAAALTDALGATQRVLPEMLIGSNFGLVGGV